MLKIKKLRIKGFTLIEILIAVLITAILAGIIVGVITSFAFKTSDRILISCLVEGAASGINACKGGQTLESIECGGIPVEITVEGNCNPVRGACSDIKVIATAKNLSFFLNNKICNFD